MQKLFASFLLLLLLVVVTERVLGQSLQDDLKLIQTSTIDASALVEQHHHNPHFLLSDHPSFIVRYNPVTLVFGSLMWVYQKTITQQLSSTCIYSPTCSSYSIDLIQEYGLLPGILFTADRLTRCNRLALYDFPESEVDHQIHRIRQEAEYYKLAK